jgi:ATP-dependent Clp protease ATP-binding subunit ClpA
MGARPMARLIQERIKKPLADELLFGKLRTGGHVRVIVRDDEDGKKVLGFEYLEGPVTPKPEEAKIAARARQAKSEEAGRQGRRRRAVFAEARQSGPESAARARLSVHFSQT